MYSTQTHRAGEVTINAKRYACDRCRDLKLRCPRSSGDDASCTRCLRADALCVTSSGRPLGRPPSHTEPYHDVGGHQVNLWEPPRKRQRDSQGCGSATISRISDHIPAQSINATYQPADNVTPNPRTGPLDDELGLRMDNIEYEGRRPSTETVSFETHNNGFFWDDFGNTQDAFQSIPGWQAAGDVLLSGAIGDCSDAFDCQILPQPDELTAYATDLRGVELETHSETHGSNCTAGGTGSMTIGLEIGEQPLAEISTNPAMSLINALGSISRELAELRRQASELPPKIADPCTFPGITPNFNFLFFDTGKAEEAMASSPPRAKLVQKAVVVAIRFVLVLQMTAPRSIEAACLSTPTSTKAMPQVTLLLVSSYLQLGELFDIILSPIADRLNRIARGTLSPDELELSGAPNTPTPSDAQQPSVQPGPLEDTMSGPHRQNLLMAVRVIEYQLRALEGLIGLPVSESPVARNHTTDSGVSFYDDSILTKAVMRQVLETMQSLKNTMRTIKVTVSR
ncbi:hypothetical protein BDV18DRAFT_155925 [Aspergillus unguis]